MRLSITLRAGVAALAASTASHAQPADDLALRPYLTGNGLLQRGMNEPAIAEYRQFLKDNPDHAKAPLARYGLALALFRLRDYGSAEVELLRLAGDPSFEFAPETLVMLGQCRLATGRPADAVEPLGRLVQSFADHDLADDAAALRVEALSRAGRHEEAVNAADDAASRWPRAPMRPRADLFAASSLIAQGSFAAAADRLREVLRRAEGTDLAPRATLLLAQALHLGNKPAEAGPLYESIVTGGDETLLPDALLGLGALRLEQGRAADAGTILDRLITRFPSSPRLNDARLRRARAWFELGEFARAVDLLDRVNREAEGGSDEASYWLAKCAMRADRFGEAATRLGDAIEKFPTSRLMPEMIYDRGVALFRSGRVDEARRALAEFRARFADHALAPDAVRLSASIAHEAGDHAGALADAGEFLERFPDNPGAPAVEFLAAESMLFSGDDAGAVRAYSAFLARRGDDPRADQASFRLGALLHRLGRGDEARPYLERVARGPGTAPEFRPALLLLGDLDFAAGDWSAARRLLGEYAAFGDDQPGADDAVLKLGLALARQDQHAEAVRAFDRLLASFPSSPHRLQAQFERGQSLAALGRPDEAAEAFTRVLEEGGEGSRFAPHAHQHLGAIESSRGHRGSAVDHFARAAALGAGTDLEADALFEQARSLAADGRHPEADAAFRTLLERFPGHRSTAEARARLAISISRQDKPEDALAAIIAAERSAGSLAPALRDSLAYEKAWCLRALGRPDEAATVCRELMERADPELKAYAAADLAQIESDAGRHAQAADILRGVLAAKPPPDVERRAAYLLGVCAFRTEKFDEASAMMDRFLASPGAPDAKDPLSTSASLVAGESCLKLGRHKLAADHLRRAADGHPDDPTRPTALLRLGEAQAVLQLWAESEATFARYLREFADSELWFQAKFGAAWAMENQGRLDDAIAAYREVTARHNGPTAARAQFQIGECLYARKEYEPAARELLKVDILYDYPEWSAAALFEAGRCFEALKDLDNARRSYDQVRERHAGTRWASLAGERLAATRTRPVPGR